MAVGAVHRAHLVAASCDVVVLGGMACLAGEVQAFGIHVHVEFEARRLERRVDVSVLDGVAAATGEVTRSTVGAAGQSDALSHADEIDGRPVLAAEGGVFIGGMACAGRELLVGAGRVVTHQAVDVSGVGEVEVGVRPSVPGVATRATRLVGPHIHAVVVDHLVLAVRLAGGFALVVPRPVDGSHEVLGLIRVTVQASRRHVGCRLEWSFQWSEAGVVDSPALLCRRGNTHGQQHAEHEHDQARFSRGG